MKFMDYDLFIQQVRTRARLRSTKAAIAATHATLSTLAERLGTARMAELSQTLPRVVDRAGVSVADSLPKLFTFDDFCQRLADREQTDVPAAVFHARCVIDTLRMMTSPREIDALAEALSRDFAPLFRGVDALRPAA